MRVECSATDDGCDDNCVMYSNSSSGPLHSRQLIHEAGSQSSDEDRPHCCRRHMPVSGYRPTSRRPSGGSRCSSDVRSSMLEICLSSWKTLVSRLQCDHLSVTNKTVQFVDFRNLGDVII